MIAKKFNRGIHYPTIFVLILLIICAVISLIMIDNTFFLYKFAAINSNPVRTANIRRSVMDPIPQAQIKTMPLDKTPEWISRGINNLKGFEGWRENPYLDSENNQTIGYGFNLNDKNVAKKLRTLGYRPGRPLSKAIGDKTLKSLVNETYIPTLNKMYPKFNTYPDGTKEALLNMVYNLGEPKLQGFKKMRKALDRRDWRRAGAEAVNSEWARQVKSRRANYVRNLIQSGR